MGWVVGLIYYHLDCLNRRYRCLKACLFGFTAKCFKLLGDTSEKVVWVRLVELGKVPPPQEF